MSSAITIARAAVRAAWHAYRRPSILQGTFGSWQAACVSASGYDDGAILARITAATEEAIRSNGRLFERDGVLFDRPITPFPLLAFLLRAAARNQGHLNVIDFGGALGSTYRQCLPFLDHLPSPRWSIVEQPHVVELGRNRFASDTLSFFDTIESAAAAAKPTAIVFSGVLQYLDDPYAVLSQAKSADPDMILIDRNPFSDASADIYSLQVVPEEIFTAKLPFRVFGSASLEDALQPAYQLVSQTGSIDPDAYAGQTRVQFLFKAFERVGR